MEALTSLSSKLYNIPSIVGFITFVRYLSKLWTFFTFHFAPVWNPLQIYMRKPRAWALVTGSSGGIGLGYAQELVARGFGIILLAHLEDELKETEQALKAEFPAAEIRILVINAITIQPAELETTLQSVLNLPITILVNNVGGTPNLPALKSLEDFTHKEIDATVNLNAGFPAHITHLMLPTLIKNGPSLILNMSSGSHIGMPWLSLYSACKGFNLSFAVAVAREVKANGHPVHSLTIIPGDVQSQSHTEGLPAGTPTSRCFAKMALDLVDRAVSRNWTVMSPFWLHALQIELLDILPERLLQLALASNIGKKKERYEKKNKSQ